MRLLEVQNCRSLRLLRGTTNKEGEDILTKKRTKKERRVQKKDERGEDSVLAQISVLVVRTFANEEKIALSQRLFPAMKL